LIILLIAIAGILTVYGMINNKSRYNYIKKCIIDSYGNPNTRVYKDGEYRHISGYNNNHKSDYSIDDITWNDLNMDMIFTELNRTQSSAGEEYLYYMLRNPRITKESIDEYNKTMEPKVSYYMDNPEKRLNMQLALFKCGRTGKYSIYDYLNNLELIADENFNQDVWLLLMYGVAIFIFFINFGLGAVIFAGLLMYGGITYFTKKRRIEPYITSFDYVFRLINGANYIIKSNNDEIANEQDRLRELTLKLNSFARFSYLIMSRNSGTGNILELVLDYIRMFFHLDLIKFFQMRDEIARHWDDIDEMLTIIGKIDASIAIASYRAYLNDYCIPEFKDGNLVANNLYHPVLINPVKNDLVLKRGIMLTGSNASGKSTMLKTVSVAAILAETVNTVPADSYTAPAYRIYTSLALNDDIFAGESYYMTEIKSLKRIMDNGCANDEHSPILACVDEVLRGTNTIERIAASQVLLRELSKVNGRILAATHDLELAELLSDIYDNYHFEETIIGNDISFAYKMLPGIATTRNAIKLLEIVGYDKTLTDEANRLAVNFEKTGKFI